MAVFFRKNIVVGEVGILVLLAAALRIAQWSSGRSIWLDEACLLLNVLERDYGDLLQPLEHNQIAPVLFLVLLKAAENLFGPGDMVFRLVPLLLSLAALPWVYPLARRWSGSREVALFTLFFFAVSPFLIRYATEVKQYTADATVCIGLCYWLTAPRQVYATREQVLLALAGLLAIGLSNIAVLVMAAAGLFHLGAAVRQPERWVLVRSVVLPYLVWAAGFGVYYALFMYQHPTRPYMEAYWQFAFMPTNPRDTAWLFWLGDRFGYFFFKIFFYDFNGWTALRVALPGYLLLWAAGMVAAWRDGRRTLLFFLFVPLALHLPLSACQLYPFDPRIALYLALPHLLCAAYGLTAFAKWLSHQWKPAATWAITASLLLIWPVQLFLNFPIQFDEVRPSLAFLRKHGHECSQIYLPGYTRDVFDYYQAIERAPIPGFVYADFPGAALPVLDSLHGQVWVLTAHLSEKEEAGLLHSLKQRGTLLQQLQTKGSGAYLFDLRMR